jgi:predicted nucleic acid-binding protein
MIAFDTNVLLYTLDDSAPAKRAVATRLVEQTSDAVLVWQVACEFVAASRKLAGLTPERAWQELEFFRSGMYFAIPSEGVLARGRQLHVADRVSFWDALLIAACREAGVTRLYSEDLPGPADVEVVNPFA